MMDEAKVVGVKASRKSGAEQGDCSTLEDDMIPSLNPSGRLRSTPGRFRAAHLGRALAGFLSRQHPGIWRGHRRATESWRALAVPGSASPRLGCSSDKVRTATTTRRSCSSSPRTSAQYGGRLVSSGRGLVAAYPPLESPPQLPARAYSSTVARLRA